jgi:hypothetical protein
MTMNDWQSLMNRTARAYPGKTPRQVITQAMGVSDSTVTYNLHRIKAGQGASVKFIGCVSIAKSKLFQKSTR